MRQPTTPTVGDVGRKHHNPAKDRRGLRALPLALVLALAAVTVTNPAHAAPKRRVLVIGFSGNASSAVKQHVLGLAMGAAQAIIPADTFPVVGCGEVHATLEGLGGNADDCYAGKLSRDDLELLFPRYLLTGEVMAVGDSHYVTVRVMDANKKALEVVTIRVDPKESAAHKGSRTLRRVLDRRLRKDGYKPRAWQDDGKIELGVEDGATKADPGPGDIAEGGGSGGTAKPAPVQPTPQKDPNAVDGTGSTQRPAPQPQGPRTVGVFFSQRLPKARDFAWDVRSTQGRDAIHQSLKAQGATVVDVVNVGGQGSGRMRQDGVLASDAAAAAFQDGKLTDGLSVRLVWTPTGDPQAPEFHLHLKMALHPKGGGKTRRLVREHTVVCGDPAGAQCQRQVQGILSGAAEKLKQKG